PFRSRDEAELRINEARILEIGLRSAQGRGGGTEFDSLRDYSVDDEFRRIDWAATARAARPIVRTYRAERNQTVLLLLDAGRLMAGRVDDVPRLDHAMDAVMMLTAVATRLGDRAGLVAFDQRVRAVVSPGHSRDQLSRVTEAMYALEPELVESDYRGAFAETLAPFRRPALLRLFTGPARPPARRRLPAGEGDGSPLGLGPSCRSWPSQGRLRTTRSEGRRHTIGQTAAMDSADVLDNVRQIADRLAADRRARQLRTE